MVECTHEVSEICRAHKLIFFLDVSKKLKNYCLFMLLNLDSRYVDENNNEYPPVYTIPNPRHRRNSVPIFSRPRTGNLNFGGW